MKKYIEAKLPFDNDKKKFIIPKDFKTNYLDELIVRYDKHLYSVINLSNQLLELNQEEELELKNIVDRKLTLNDKKQIALGNLTKEKYQQEIILLIKKLKLNMKFIGLHITLDNRKMLLIYTSNVRVDFRDLVKEMAKKYKMKIELKQIGVRDRSKIIGGYGSCGQKLCCNRFLKDFDSINISLAKNQNLALNPNKINGVCGRLMCCLKYEQTNDNIDKCSTCCKNKKDI